MPAQWLSKPGELPERLTDALEGILRGLTQASRVRRLRQILLTLLVLWAALALARLLWALLPVPESATVADIPIINPLTQPSAVTDAPVVDIDSMRRWHLFGEAGVAPADSVETALEPAVGTAAREGIEQGARATRLQLVLRGVVASSEDGLGHAIIEYRKKQDVYAVEDKLPVPGQVVLAKVMPRQVVLDNSGTYELLTLFEDSELNARLPQQGTGNIRQRVPDSVRVIDKRTDADTTTLARSYRERLYQNPQSLAEVVSVNAVRENGELLGYRISPGKDEEQFKRLGFKPGDLVTGVNGIALNDPANTMRLYQTMRSASEAVFDLQRNELQLSVSVSLDSTATEH